MSLAATTRCIRGPLNTLMRLRGPGGLVRGISSACLIRPTVTSRFSPVNHWRLTPVPLFQRFKHTSGDTELVSFLKDEIKLEKNADSGKLPKLKGFELTSTDGPNVVLTKKADNETIVIKLNVNHSVDEAGHSESDKEQEAKEPEMICKPSFVVEINKGGNSTLAIQCIFPPEDDMPHPDHEGQETYEDLIEIQEVTLLNKSQEWTEDVYSLSGGVMDGNLYDMLLKLLEERGIDADFIQQLVDFSTSYEHTKYVHLLEQLQEFANAK